MFYCCALFHLLVCIKAAVPGLCRIAPLHFAFNNTWDPARLWLVLAFAGAPRTLSSESGSISPVRRVRRKRRGIKKAAKTSTFGFQHFLYVQVCPPPLLRGLRPGDRNEPPMNNKYIHVYVFVV